MTLFLLQFKDGVNVDLPSTDKIKVSRDDFQQALLDVKPVSACTSNVTMQPVHIANPQAFGVSNEQLDKYIRNGEYVCFVVILVYLQVCMHVLGLEQMYKYKVLLKLCCWFCTSN